MDGTLSRGGGALALGRRGLDQLLVADLLAGGAPVAVGDLADQRPDPEPIALRQPGGPQHGLVDRVDEDALAAVREGAVGDGDLDPEARLAAGATADGERGGVDLVRVDPGDRAEELGVGRAFGLEQLGGQLVEQLCLRLGRDRPLG